MHSLVEMANNDNADMFSQMALEIKSEFYRSKRLLFIKGEIGKKFYLIIKGKVNALISKEKIISSTEEEYISYLIKLRKYREFALIRKCLKRNKSVFPDTDFRLDNWLLNNDYAIKDLTNLFLSKDLIEEIKKALIFLSEDHSDEDINTEEYINRIAFESFKEQVPKRRLFIYFYAHVSTLEEDQLFGEMALMSEKKKRTATIVVEEDTHFGVISKHTFKKCLFEVNEKLRKHNIQFFLSIPMFKDLTSKKFSKKYYNYFKFNKVQRNENIAVESEQCMSYIFIKSGEFEVMLKKKSILNINEILRYLGWQFTLNEEMDEKVKIYEDPSFDKYMNEARSFKITVLRPQEIVGFEDSVMKGNYIFTIKGLISSNEFYKLNRESFDIIVCGSVTVQENLENYIRIRKQYLIQRLLEIKSSFISFYESKLKMNREKNISLPKNIFSVTKKDKIAFRNIKVKQVEDFVESANKLNQDEYVNNLCIKTVKFLNNVKKHSTHRSIQIPERKSRNNVMIPSSPIHIDLGVFRISSRQTTIMKSTINANDERKNEDDKRTIHQNIDIDLKKLNNSVKKTSKSFDLRNFPTNKIDKINEEKKRIRIFSRENNNSNNQIKFSKIYIQKQADFMNGIEKSTQNLKSTIFNFYSQTKNSLK